MKGQKIGYVRVSTTDQNPDRQLAGMEMDKVFTEYASGKSTMRPILVTMMEYIREGDTLYVHSLDRLARNLLDLKTIVNKLVDKGVHVHFMKENLQFMGKGSPIANLNLSILGGIAEFEREIILERQREGIAVAKAKGKYRGAPKKLSNLQCILLKEEVKKGRCKAEIARELRITTRTLYNYLKAI